MALWTPADIATALWLDAADSSTLFDAISGGSLVAADGAVARWEDKSGNARHATQETPDSRGTRVISGVNGLNSINLDGVNDFFSADAVAAIFTGEDKPISIVCASKRTTANRQDAIWSLGYSSSSTPVVSIRSTNNADGTENLVRTLKRNNAGSVISQTSSIAWGTNARITAIVDSGLSTEVFQDGNSAISTYSSNAGVISLDRYTIGATFIGAFLIHLFLGLMCELIALPVLSTDDRQKAEGYLAHKWGLAASLPSDHPYKSAAPTTGTTIQTRRRRDLGGFGL